MSTAVIEREPEHLEKIGAILRKARKKELSPEEITGLVRRKLGGESPEVQRAYANAVRAVQEQRKKGLF